MSPKELRDSRIGGKMTILNRSSTTLLYCARGKFPQRGFCTSWTRIRGRILGCEFLSPEFWSRILGSNFLVLCFPTKRAPSKIHPQEIHRPKFTSKNSPQNSGWKIHIALLQGHFADTAIRLVFVPLAAKVLRTPQSTHHPHKSHEEHRQCNPGGGIHFAVLLGSDNSYTTPLKSLFFLIRSPLWWRYMVGGPLVLAILGMSE